MRAGGLSWCPAILWDADLHTCVAAIAEMCNKTHQPFDRTLGQDEESLEMRRSPCRLARPGIPEECAQCESSCTLLIAALSERASGTTN